MNARGRGAALGRVILWLVPAERRDWVEALWAESAALPAGPERMRWRVSAAWLGGREALRAARTRGWITFAVAAALAAAGCVPGSAANVLTAGVWANVVAVVGVLAAVGWVSRQAFGPVRAGWLPNALRAVCYGAILALLPATAVALRYDQGVVQAHPFLHRYAVARGYQGPPVLFLDAFVLGLLGCWVLAVLGLTSARSRVTARTLALTMGFGLVFGTCGYLVAPLGPRGTTGIDAVNPWLPQSWSGGVTIADWVLLFAGPAILGPAAGLCFAGRGNRGSLAERRFAQCLCVGVAGSVVAALTATAASSATIAAALEFPGAANYLDRGANLTGTAAYLWGLNAGSSEGAYVLVCFCVPVVGFLVSAVVGAVTFARSFAVGGEVPPSDGGDHGGGGNGRGGPPRDPVPRSPDTPLGGRAADAPGRHPVLTG